VLSHFLRSSRRLSDGERIPLQAFEQMWLSLRLCSPATGLPLPQLVRHNNTLMHHCLRLPMAKLAIVAPMQGGSIREVKRGIVARFWWRLLTKSSLLPALFSPTIRFPDLVLFVCPRSIVAEHSRTAHVNDAVMH